jgi:hypothetical protein
MSTPERTITRADLLQRLQAKITSLLADTEVFSDEMITDFEHTLPPNDTRIQQLRLFKAGLDQRAGKGMILMYRVIHEYTEGCHPTMAAREKNQDLVRDMTDWEAWWVNSLEEVDSPEGAALGSRGWLQLDGIVQPLLWFWYAIWR